YTKVIDRVPIDKGISGRVYRYREPILVEDVSKDPDFLDAMSGLVSEVCVPLFDQGMVVGFFNVESSDGVRLTTSDLRPMTGLSQQMNIAIERARLYTELRESEELFRTLFDHAPIGMVIIALDGRYLRVNTAYCNIIGYSTLELLTMSFQDVTHPEDLPNSLLNIDKVLRGEGQSYALEKRAVRKDGRVVNLSLHASLIMNADGKALHIV